MSDFPMTRFDFARPAAGRIGWHHPVGWLRVALRVYLTRKELPGMTARDFADIGISPVQAAAEAARLPWDTNPGPRGRDTGLMRALERARSRRLISRMSVRELRDIGISPSDAQAEATKCFWQV